jgi:thiosulfate/3-mercaptopyruvate sulfurtransferase
MMKGYSNPQLLVTAEELSDELRVGQATTGPWSPASDLLVLDLRPAEDFAAGHIPGAFHLDLWALSLNDTDDAPLRSFLWMIAHVLATRGIDPTRRVVVYDERSGMRAARAFWFLEYFGHPDVCLLDGGFGAWTRAGLPVETDVGRGSPPRRPPKQTVEGWPERADPHRDRLATWRDVQARLGAKAAAILDTRSDEEYYGEVARAKRAGAVPGAVHVEWTRNLGADGAFRPAAELRDMYEKAGITPDREVVTYCQGGYRAAHSYLALRLIGYPKVRTYLGSWKEWGDREDLPIEKPVRRSALGARTST